MVRGRLVLTPVNFWVFIFYVNYKRISLADTFGTPAQKRADLAANFLFFTKIIVLSKIKSKSPFYC